MAVYVQKLVDHVLIDGNRRLLNLMSLTTLVIIAFRIFLNTMKSLFILRTGQTIDAVLILGYYHHLLRLPQRFFDTMRVGESGCGKSTLIALLQEIYPFEAGTIRIGGMDLRHLSARSLRRAIAEVPQRIDLFNGSVLEKSSGWPSPGHSTPIPMCFCSTRERPSC